MTNLPKLPSDPPKEPALTTGVMTGTFGGLIYLITALFPDLLTDKQATVLAVVGAFALPIISAIFTRGQVWSPYSVKELIDDGVSDAVKELDKTKKPPKSDPFDTPWP